MIASLTGLSAGTIGRIRDQEAAADDSAGVRVGKDGRARPVDGSGARIKVYELLLSDPTASIRDIAQRGAAVRSPGRWIRPLEPRTRGLRT